MNPLNFNSILEFIGEFFSELPPQALAIVSSIITLTLYVAGGVVVASIVGFLALGITRSGPTILIIYTLVVAASLIYGIIRSVHNYKKIMLSYKNTRT